MSSYYDYICVLTLVDVYGQVDATHYPAFHQMEGVKLLDECTDMQVS
jgi:phenylalanyl-tRNA synthetase alpha subunit